MRKLNAKQRNELEKLCMKYYHDWDLFPQSAWDLSPSELERISNLNIHEDFEGNVDRYISDLQYKLEGWRR